MEFLTLKKANCKNCYKCIRHCPVKAIRFSGNQAHIIGNECILCGQCFVVCPQNAKQIVNETEKAKVFIQSGDPVYVSLAPSFVANYPGVGIESMRKALKKLGFTEVEETAVGATIVKREYDRIMREEERDVVISSCCHSINLLIQKQFPSLLPYLADVVSPMQAHCADIKRREPNANTGVEIYTSTRSDAKWSAPVKFEITADTISSYGHPAVSPDGTWLYFTSDMPGGSGGKDLWRINLKERQGSLENMGEFINTPGDEMFPYVRTDSILYFASDGHPGFGGLDLFKATLTPSGGWKVENMGQPMNSSADDFGITFGKGESGFFSTNRNDGRGYDHIYSFILPDLEIWISGWVLDKDEEPVPNAVIRIVGNDGSNQKAVAKPDGSFRFPLQRGISYVMLAGAKGYLNAKQEFTSDTAEEDAEYNVDFILASINKPVVVDNIFYDFDKATLRPESKAALDSLAQVLRDNPNVTIEMASHTDRWGSEEYNINLSGRRAKSVIDYLISVGIKPDRLQSQGYGKSRPKTITKKLARLHPQFKEGDVLTPEYIEALTEEDQEVADQINRRTEFQVLSIDYRMY